MKKWISALLAIALVLSLAPTVSAATPLTVASQANWENAISTIANGSGEYTIALASPVPPFTYTNTLTVPAAVTSLTIWAATSGQALSGQIILKGNTTLILDAAYPLIVEDIVFENGGSLEVIGTMAGMGNITTAGSVAISGTLPSSSLITVASGGSLTLEDNAQANDITFAGTGTLTLATGAGAEVISAIGDLSVAFGGGNSVTGISAGADLTLSGDGGSTPITLAATSLTLKLLSYTGTSGITFFGGGALHATGTNSVVGISSAGNLAVTGSGALTVDSNDPVIGIGFFVNGSLTFDYSGALSIRGLNTGIKATSLTFTSLPQRLEIRGGGDFAITSSTTITPNENARTMGLELGVPRIYWVKPAPQTPPGEPAPGPRFFSDGSSDSFGPTPNLATTQTVDAKQNPGMGGGSAVSAVVLWAAVAGYAALCKKRG